MSAFLSGEKMKKSEIIFNIITIILILIIVIAALFVAKNAIQPNKVIVQKWTDPDDGKVYIICTDYIIPVE